MNFGDGIEKLVIPLVWIEQQKQPIVIHCEWCNHKVTSYEPLPESLTCNNCKREIDLK